MIINTDILFETEKNNGTLFFKKILSIEYFLESNSDKGYLILTFLLSNEKNRFSLKVCYSEVKNFIVRNIENYILPGNPMIIDNKNKSDKNNYNYKISDKNIEFFCNEIEILEIKKI